MSDIYTENFRFSYTEPGHIGSCAYKVENIAKIPLREPNWAHSMGP